MNVTKVAIDYGATSVKIGIFVQSDKFETLISHIYQNQLIASKIKLTCKPMLDNDNDCLLLIADLRNDSRALTSFIRDLNISDEIILVGIKSNSIYKTLSIDSNLTLRQIDEMTALSSGVITCIKNNWYAYGNSKEEHQLLGKKILVASFGTGTSLLLIDEQLEIKRIGGTCLGATTLSGIKRIFELETVDNITTSLISDFCHILTLYLISNNCDL